MHVSYDIEPETAASRGMLHARIPAKLKRHLPASG
jgi:hypothetical protein